MIEVKPEVLEALRECCAYRAPIVMIDTGAGRVYHARLAAVTEECITVEVADPSEAPPEKTNCCVSFACRGESRAFFVRVLRHVQQPPPGLLRVNLEISSGPMGLEARMAFRVPVGTRQGVAVRLTLGDDTVLAPRPVDLSLTGILVEFEPHEDPHLAPGTRVEIELRLDLDSVRLNAEVVHRTMSRYGLYFPDVVHRGGISPPEALMRIVEILDKTWLQDQVRS